MLSVPVGKLRSGYEKYYFLFHHYPLTNPLISKARSKLLEIIKKYTQRLQIDKKIYIYIIVELMRPKKKNRKREE